MSILHWGQETLANAATNVTQSHSRVAVLTDGTFVVVWTDFGPDLIGGDVKARRFDATGAPISDEIVIAGGAGYQDYPYVCATSNGGFMVVFEGFGAMLPGGGTTEDVYLAQVSGGNNITTHRLNTQLPNAQYDPEIVRLNDSRFVVTWEESNSENRYYRLLDAAGFPTGSDVLMPGAGGTGFLDPSIVALKDGGFASVWAGTASASTPPGGVSTDVYIQFFTTASLTAGSVIRVNQTLTSNQETPDVVTLASGRVLVTWVDGSTSNDGDSTCIKARLFDGVGNAVGVEFIVNTTFTASQTGPRAVAMRDGSFVVAWLDDSGIGSGAGSIRAQHFDGLGNRIGGEAILLADIPLAFVALPDLQALPDGRLIVNYLSSDSNGSGVFFQIFDPRDGVVIGSSSLETIYGHDRVNDQIDGLAGIDTIYGLGGDDLIYGRAGGDVLDGGAGNDVLDGGADADTLYGGDGDDTLYGGAGAADILQGGDGRDTASYLTALTAVLLNINIPSASTGDATGDSFNSIEVFVGSNFADEFLGTSAAEEFWGSYGADILRGNGGADSLYGGWGLDNLEGGAGADYLDGGQERDIASYANAASGLRASLDNASVNTGDAAGDAYVNIEGLSGTTLGDDLIGDANANFLFGNGGADVLWGQGGADELYGEAGNDWLVGGAGADKIDGGADFDTVRYSFASAGVRADLKDAWTGTGDAAGDTYFSVEGLVGSDFNDTLLGDDSNNEVWGDYGDDQIFGRGGTDQLSGGNGLDTFLFTTGWGNDTIIDYKVGGAEKLNFQGVSGLTSFGQLAVTVGASGTTVVFGGNTVFLQNIFALSAGDCVF